MSTSLRGLSRATAGSGASDIPDYDPSNPLGSAVAAGMRARQQDARTGFVSIAPEWEAWQQMLHESMGSDPRSRIVSAPGLPNDRAVTADTSGDPEWWLSGSTDPNRIPGYAKAKMNQSLRGLYGAT